MPNAARTMTEFSATTPLLLAELREEFSKGENPLVERICKALLQDLDDLCAFVAQVGAKKAEQMNLPNVNFSRISTDPFTGAYVGFILGQQRLGLGFLESVVVHALSKKFAAASTVRFDNENPSHAVTIAGPVRLDEWIYTTPTGTFRILHSHSWFIDKKIA